MCTAARWWWNKPIPARSMLPTLVVTLIVRPQPRFTISGARCMARAKGRNGVEGEEVLGVLLGMFPEAHRLDHKVAADNTRCDPGIVDEDIYPEPLAYRVHQTVHVFSVDQVRAQISRPLAIPTQNA